jgi:adenosylcobyric acid synthase
VILPGTKTTVADLTWLHESGLAAAIRDVAAAGRPVIGICGGFQMLGQRVADPDGLEGVAATVNGLGLLPVTTTFAGAKRTVRVRARVVTTSGLLGAAAGCDVAAYEIHVGQTESAGDPAFAITAGGLVGVDERDGAVSADGMVMGTYLHGLFANDELRGAMLSEVATRAGRTPDPRWGSARPAIARYDRLADVVADAVDVPAVAKLLGVSWPRA